MALYSFIEWFSPRLFFLFVILRRLLFLSISTLCFVQTLVDSEQVDSRASEGVSPRLPTSYRLRLKLQRSKHPSEDRAAFAIGKAQAKQRPRIIAVDVKAQPNKTMVPLEYVQGYLPEMKTRWKLSSRRRISQSAAGSSRLRYSHRQAALCEELVEEITEIATLVFPAGFYQYVSVGASVEAGGLRWCSSKDYWRCFLPYIFNRGGSTVLQRPAR